MEIFVSFPLDRFHANTQPAVRLALVSIPPAKRNLPSGVKYSDPKLKAGPRASAVLVPDAISHICIDALSFREKRPPLPAVAKVLPSGENARETTVSFPVNSLFIFPFCASHKINLLKAVTKRVLLGAKQACIISGRNPSPFNPNSKIRPFFVSIFQRVGR